MGSHPSKGGGGNNNKAVDPNAALKAQQAQQSAFWGMGSPTTSAKMTSTIQNNPVAYPTTSTPGVGYTMAGQDGGPALPKTMAMPVLPPPVKTNNNYNNNRGVNAGGTVTGGGASTAQSLHHAGPINSWRGNKVAGIKPAPAGAPKGSTGVWGTSGYHSPTSGSNMIFSGRNRGSHNS